MSRSDPRQEIVEDLGRFAKDPYGFVKWAFDWGHGELEGKSIEPWQAEQLKSIRDGLKTIEQVIRESTGSGHGVGKSALVAWLILWALSTFGDTRGVVTANTETQLRTKTWPELGKWYRLFIANFMFEFTATAIYSRAPGHDKTWRIDAIPWSETNTEAFAGLHNQGRRILVVFDEASAIADRIYDVTEGALTDKDTEIIWCLFGNLTRNSGRFRDTFHSLRHRWKTRTIDSRTVSFTNKDQIQKWQEDYGDDSDFFRVRVRGLEPNQSTLQFIPADVVQAARGRKLRADQYMFAPVILTVDPAWTGSDELVIGKRQGLAFAILRTVPRNDDDMKIASMLAKYEDDEKADAVFIDLGYGTGIFSAGKQLGREWILVPFGGAANDPQYANKRMEMWALTKEWLKAGGCIPGDQMLCDDLTGPEAYIIAVGKNAGKLILESKDDMRKRGLPSPNRGDALALSFAFPVMPKGLRSKRGKPEFASSKEWDPFADLEDSRKAHAEVH